MVHLLRGFQQMRFEIKVANDRTRLERAIIVKWWNHNYGKAATRTKEERQIVLCHEEDPHRRDKFSQSITPALLVIDAVPTTALVLLFHLMIEGKLIKMY